MVIYAIIIGIQKAFQKQIKPDLVVDLWEVLCKNVISIMSVLFGKKSFETTCMFSLLQLCMLLLAAYTELVYTELVKAKKVEPRKSLSDLISSDYKILYSGANPIMFVNISHAVNIIFDGRLRLAQALLNLTKKHNPDKNFTLTNEMEFLPGFPDGISEFDDILKYIANDSNVSTANGKDNDQSLKKAYFADIYPSTETMLWKLDAIVGKNYDCHKTTENLGGGVNFHMHFHALKDKIIARMLRFKESGWNELIAKSIAYTDHLIFQRKYYREVSNGNLSLTFNPKVKGRNFGFLKPLCVIYGTCFLLGCAILFLEILMFRTTSPAFRLKVKFKLQKSKSNNNARFAKVSKRLVKEFVLNKNPDKNRSLFQSRERK